jgi:hypothetical protein
VALHNEVAKAVDEEFQYGFVMAPALSVLASNPESCNLSPVEQGNCAFM